MYDYKTALKEYQELQYIIKSQINDLVFLIDKANSFKAGMISIEESLKFSLDNNFSEQDEEEIQKPKKKKGKKKNKDLNIITDRNDIYNRTDINFRKI